MSKRVKWWGTAGHFICAYDCLFHMHTHVGKFCISTVGEHRPSFDGGARLERKPQTMGAGPELYETMVFPLGDDDAPSSWTEIEARRYMTEDEASAGHMSFVELYLNGDT